MKQLAAKVRRLFTGNMKLDLGKIPKKDREKAEDLWKREMVKRMLREGREEGQVNIA